MFESWALDVVDKCQRTFVLEVFIDKGLVIKVWFTYGRIVFSWSKSNITYGWESWSYNYVEVMNLQEFSLQELNFYSLVIAHLVMN